MTFLNAFLLVYIVTVLLYLWRLSKVARYRNDVLKRVSLAARQDIYQMRDWAWRFKEMEQVGFGEMVFQFWKPLKSFYRQDPARSDQECFICRGTGEIRVVKDGNFLSQPCLCQEKIPVKK